SNLDLLGGVTEDTIRHFIRSFDQELTAWNPVSEEEIFKKATPDRIEKVLNAMNIKYEKKQQGDVVSYDFNKNNFDLRLISFGGSDLMIDCIWRGAQPLAKLNQWNLKRHYVRAVLYDNKGNPYVALESNLDCVAGTSESIIRYFISTFETEASAFDGHLKAKRRGVSPNERTDQPARSASDGQATGTRPLRSGLVRLENELLRSRRYFFLGNSPGVSSALPHSAQLR